MNHAAVRIALLTSGLTLLAAPVSAQEEVAAEASEPVVSLAIVGAPVAGTATTVVTTGRGGVPVADQRITVRVPAEDPEIELVLTERGGTLVHARLLSEQFTRAAAEPIPGVPAEKLAAGQIDLVTTWSPIFLPFTLAFHQLDAGDQEIRHLVRRATEGRIVAGRLAPPERPGGASVDREIAAGDSVHITAPASIAGRLTIARVDPSGAAELSGRLPEADAEDVSYEIWRVGDAKSLWDEGPMFTRVSEAAGLPVTYVWPDPRTDSSPFYVEKRFEAGQHPWELSLRVTVHNVSRQPLKQQLGMRVSGWQHPGTGEAGLFSRPTDLSHGSCRTGDGLERHEYGSLYEEPQSFTTHTEWVGVDTQYFLLAAAAEDLQGGQCRLDALPPPVGVTSATLWAPSGQTINAGDRGCRPDWLAPASGDGAPLPACGAAFDALGHQPGDSLKLVRASWQTKREDLGGEARQALDDAWSSIKSRQRAVYRFRLFVGPKDSERLEASGHHLETSLDFGILAVIAEPMLAFLKFLHSLLGHWGLAIVVLTVSLKSLLLPLTNKSFTQMQRMSSLRPKLDELKAQHGDDREGFAKAQMALFKREKVNPLGGCFPMVVQMPIWFALYQVIYSSVELFHAPLGLWIQDLSAPDPFYVTPVLLGLLMLVQSYFTPTATAGDATQQKIMKYGMPLMFSVFMIALPAGLVLYILCNTVLTILQNIIIRRRMA